MSQSEQNRKDWYKGTEAGWKRMTEKCQRSTAYPSVMVAETEAARMVKKHASDRRRSSRYDFFYTFQCPVCQAWHLTTKVQTGSKTG